MVEAFDPPPSAAQPLRAFRHVVDLPVSAEHDNFAFWEEQTGSLARTSLVSEADRPQFALQVAVAQFGAMNVSTTRLSHAVRIVRSAQDIARTGLSHLVFQLYVEGAPGGICGTRPLAMAPGDLCVLDMARPYAIEISPCTIVALMAPREDLPAVLRTRDLHGRVAHRDSATGRLLAGHLAALDAAAAMLTVGEGITAGQALLMLAEAAFPADYAGLPLPDDPQEQAVFDQACAYVEAQIGDPDFSPVRMAEALGVSRTSLYRLFESAGGVGAYVRERRLLRCHEIIDSDLQPQVGLGDIGIRQGFGSEAYFSRAYKDRFGISPGAARKAAQARRRRGEGAAAPPQTPGIPPQSFRVPKS